MCYFTLEGVYDKRILIKVLDSYEIFDYRLVGTRLVKTGKKSYEIQENHTSKETSSLLLCHAIFLKIKSIVMIVQLFP